MTSCLCLTIKQLFQSAMIKRRGIGTCQPTQGHSVHRSSPKTWALDIDINLTLIHFPCYEWLKLFFKKIEAPLISLLTLPLLSSSRPAQSPSFVTNFPTYRIVPSSISPRHFTWTRAPGFMLWKKTIDHIFCLSENQALLQRTETTNKCSSREKLHILFFALIGVIWKIERFYPIKSDVRFGTRCHG